jgi:broad specificity phosphatase PhoE
MSNKLLASENGELDDVLLKQDRQEFEGAHAVIFRHANSMANAGFRTNGVKSILLSEKGMLQAEYVASFFSKAPSKIIHSPFIRTRLTADPLITRFSDVEVVEWPIQEFTYLNPENYIGTTVEERRSDVNKYWLEADPNYRDGGEAESFADLWQRVADFRDKISLQAPGSVVFSHGQFMRMLMCQMTLGMLEPNSEAMKVFKHLEETEKLANTFRLEISKTGVLSKPKLTHLPPELITF